MRRMYRICSQDTPNNTAISSSVEYIMRVWVFSSTAHHSSGKQMLDTKRTRRQRRGSCTATCRHTYPPHCAGSAHFGTPVLM